MVDSVGAVVVAGLLALLSPRALAHVPEPAESEPDKIAYRELANLRGLGVWLALASMAYAAVAAWLLGDPKLLPAWVLLAVVGPLLAYVDWHTHRLPYVIVAPTYVGVWLATALSAALIGDWNVLVRAAIGNAVVFCAFWVLAAIGNYFYRGKALGYGDVRLSAVIGTALGPLGFASVFVGIYAGFALGAVIGLILVKGKLRGTMIAFGPYMVFGALAGLLF